LGDGTRVRARSLAAVGGEDLTRHERGSSDSAPIARGSTASCWPAKAREMHVEGAKFPLCHQPEPDNRKVMIERVGKPNSRALHDRKAGGIDGGQLVQVRASKIFPRLLQIAQLAGKDFYGAGLTDGFFPRQRHVPVGVAIEECECLDDDGNAGMKFRAGSVQQVPLLSRLRR
jgi:hypothetical protein